MAEKTRVVITTERRQLPVRFGAMSGGSTDAVEVDVCMKCSAIVFDPITHYVWHRGGGESGNG